MAWHVQILSHPLLYLFSHNAFVSEMHYEEYYKVTFGKTFSIHCIQCLILLSECTVILYPIHCHVAVLETHVRRGIGQLVSLESNVEL